MAGLRMKGGEEWLRQTDSKENAQREVGRLGRTRLLGTVGHMIMSVFISKAVGSHRREIDRNPQQSLKMANETPVYSLSAFSAASLLTTNQWLSLHNSTPKIRKVFN